MHIFVARFSKHLHVPYAISLIKSCVWACRCRKYARGSGARSPGWRQIKADAIDLPVSVTDTIETIALGAGILGLTGSGLIDSLNEAIGITTHVIETRDPHPETHRIYKEHYQLYRASYFSLLPVFERAARIKL